MAASGERLAWSTGAQLERGLKSSRLGEEAACATFFVAADFCLCSIRHISLRDL
jgi:hypothetical protein